jgi:hypothetical protein
MSLYVAGMEFSFGAWTVTCASGMDSDFCSAVPAQAISAEVDARAKRNKEDFI